MISSFIVHLIILVITQVLVIITHMIRSLCYVESLDLKETLIIGDSV